MGMLNPGSRRFSADSPAMMKLFKQAGDLHDVCTQNYIYRRWFDDFR